MVAFDRICLSTRSRSCSAAVRDWRYCRSIVFLDARATVTNLVDKGISAMWDGDFDLGTEMVT